MVFVVITLNCCLFDRPVHALDLSIGPRMLDLGESVLNAMFAADAVKNVLASKSVPFLIGELNAIVSEDDVDPVRHCGNQIAQKLCRQHLASLGVQFDIGKLAGSINGNKEKEFALSRLNLSNVDMEITNRVKFKLLLRRLVALDIGNLAMPCRCKQRCNEERVSF